MASPPKPWERAGAGGATGAALSSMPSTTTTASATTTSVAGTPPSLPARPDSLSSVVNRTAQNYSTYNSNRFGTSPYGMGGFNNYSSYSSPYNRFGGGYGGSMYGGIGGIGGYGSYGASSMYGGMPGMYGGMPGMPGDPNNPSLTQSFSQSTQATFQLIESIVGAFGGFSQMLESTFMATHSSFFAMVSVAEQFGNLRQTLGSVLGIYTLMRWIRAAIAKLTGRPPPASSKELTPAKFAAFNGRLPDGSPAPPTPSRKPMVVFLLAVFGLPYLMGKLIKALARSQEEEERRRLEENPHMVEGDQATDPNKLEFCRVLYDYTPESAANNNMVPDVDLMVKKGDLVAVLSKSDPFGQPSDWWRCRSRDGRMGYLPSPYLEPIPRRTQPAQITSGSQQSTPIGSRAQTMTNTVSLPNSRAATLTESKVPVMAKHAGPELKWKSSDISLESFQKNMFNP